MTDRTDVRRAALRRQLVERVISTHHHVHRRIAVIVGATLVVGAAASSLAFFAPWSAPVQDHGYLHCRAGASVGSIDVVTAAGVSSLDPPGTQPRFGDARQTCAALWRQGILVAGDDFPPDVAQPSAGQAPPMVTCVDADNVPVVVPGRQPSLCTSLGLGIGTGG